MEQFLRLPPSSPVFSLALLSAMRAGLVLVFLVYSSDPLPGQFSSHLGDVVQRSQAVLRELAAKSGAFEEEGRAHLVALALAFCSAALAVHDAAAAASTGVLPPATGVSSATLVLQAMRTRSSVMSKSSGATGGLLLLSPAQSTGVQAALRGLSASHTGPVHAAVVCLASLSDSANVLEIGLHFLPALLRAPYADSSLNLRGMRDWQAAAARRFAESVCVQESMAATTIGSIGRTTKVVL